MVTNVLKTAFTFLNLRPSSRSYTSSVQHLATVATVFLLLFFSTIITTNMMAGSSIECSNPVGSGLTQNFVHSYCWNENMFSIPQLQEKIYVELVPYPGVGPKNTLIKESSTRFHVYYQWVPIVLAAQALLMAAPQFMWKYMEGKHAISLASVIKASNLELDDLKYRCTTVARYILASKSSRQAVKYFYWFWICSFLQVLVVVFIGWSTDVFLIGRFANYGPQVLNFWRFGGDIDPIHATFPRMAKCNIEHYGTSGTIQESDYLCFLGASSWHSKAFFILWWWYVISFVLCLAGLFMGTIFILKRFRIYFVTCNLFDSEEHRKCIEYVNFYFTIHDCLLFYLLRCSLEPLVYAQILRIALYQTNEHAIKPESNSLLINADSNSSQDCPNNTRRSYSVDCVLHI